MLRCPKCGSTRIDQNKSFCGSMVCLDCWFRVEDKTATPNPFYVETEEEVDNIVEPVNADQVAQLMADSDVVFSF